MCPDTDEHAPHESAATSRPNKKVTLTISTLSGDYTDDFPPQKKLHAVVEQAIAHLGLVGDGPWVLEHNGVDVPQAQTIEEAGLKDGTILTLNPQEGGGGSERQ